MGESLREWLDDRVERSADCERALREDGRDDEATLERIQRLADRNIEKFGLLDSDDEGLESVPVPEQGEERAHQI